MDMISLLPGQACGAAACPPAVLARATAPAVAARPVGPSHARGAAPRRAAPGAVARLRAARPRPPRLRLRARGGGGGSYDDEDYAEFDDEEEWSSGGGGGSLSPAAGPLLRQAGRAVSLVVDRLAGAAQQLAPAGADPASVRVAVNAGLVLLAVSFIKGVLSFFLTLGTVVFGAYLAVRMFGLDPGGGDGISRRGGGKRRAAGSGRRKGGARSRGEFLPLLGAGSDDDDDGDGLLEVRWDRRGGGSSDRRR